MLVKPGVGLPRNIDGAIGRQPHCASVIGVLKEQL
jgi:hypothetical protein